MEKVFVTNSSKETQKLGEELVQKFNFNQGLTLEKALVLTLYGDLGSGKTTFVQGLAKGLGIGERIISPTFVIMREHRIKNKELRIKNFYHLDLYRIQDSREIEDLGMQEIISDPQGIVAVEWAERIKNILPKERIDIKFEYVGKRARRITVRNNF
ncbi:tRNA (adenosine(37)-N6)-threonylcarbamoyltransferase complex ATPase subunit type 1 TsaE [Patescibacteria group bacterium]|nr:tRNA (adenosine(37)-N6)-threonylcarbamoyltransferase complex ATPase subunit type 1 TsaE [Patescibacteria group bacterium]MCL5010155.1 tRNA (adenosine(37)-N6)-threonylcarbamoyltransferase complex ATPase subunit type 1 TsaE [Patescibacteria group bacterium]